MQMIYEWCTTCPAGEKRRRREERSLCQNIFFKVGLYMKTCNFDTHTQKISLKSLKLLTRHGVLFRRSFRPVHPFILILKSTVNRLPFNRTLGFCCHLLVYMWSVRQKTKKKKLQDEMKTNRILEKLLQWTAYFPAWGLLLFVYYNYHVFSETKSTQTQGSNLQNCHMLFILFMFNTTFLKRYSYVYITLRLLP